MEVILYPDCHIGLHDFATAALYFDTLSIRLAGGMEPDPWLAPHAERGVVKFVGAKRPFPDDIRKILDEYLRWARDHFGSMKDLKGWADARFGDEETTSHILRHLEGAPREPEGGVDPDSWKSHLILYLAKKLDENRSGIDDLLSRAERAGRSITSILGIEEGEETIPPSSVGRPSAYDGYCIGERIGAWHYLFGEQLPRNAALAATDPYAHERIVEWGDRLVNGSGGENFTMTRLGALTLPAPTAAGAAKALEDREGWCLAPRAAIGSFLEDAVSDSTERGEEPLRQRYSGLEAAMKDALAKSIPPAHLSGIVQISFVLFKGIAPTEVLKGVSHPPNPGSPAGSKEAVSLFLLLERVSEKG